MSVSHETLARRERILTAMRAEFERQREENGAFLGWYDDSDPELTVIDGWVDLPAMAAAIEGALTDE